MESTLSYVDEWVSKKKNEVSTGCCALPSTMAREQQYPEFQTDWEDQMWKEFSDDWQNICWKTKKDPFFALSCMEMSFQDKTPRVSV